MTNDAVVLWIPILTTAIGLAAIIAATGLRRGDLISPFSTSLTLLIAIFGIRPIVMFTNSSFWFYGLDVSDGFQQASLIGLCGITALSGGYFLSRATQGPILDNGTESTSPEHAHDSTMGVAVTVGTLILLAWFAITAYVGGGVSFVAQTFEGRSADIALAYSGVPAGVPALPVAAGIVVALSRITTGRSRPLSIRENINYWLVVALAIVPPAALGSRRFLIPTLIAGLTGACFRSWARRISTLMFLGAAAITFVLALVPYIRSAGSRSTGDGLIASAADHIGATGVVGVINDFFLSYDTEMFSYVAFVAPRLGSDPSDIPYGLGRGTFLEAALAALPHSLLPDQTWSNSLLTSIFGGECGTVNCPVPSVFGTLYFDWSFPGLILGCAIAGFLFAKYGSWLRAAKGTRLALMLILGSFAPLMARGNVVSQAWIAAQVLIAVLVGLAIGRVITHLASAQRRVHPPNARGANRRRNVPIVRRVEDPVGELTAGRVTGNAQRHV